MHLSAKHVWLQEVLSRSVCHTIKKPDMALAIQLKTTGSAVHLGLGLNQSIRMLQHMTQEFSEELEQVSKLNKGESGCFWHTLPFLSPAAYDIVCLTADRLYMLVTDCILAACARAKQRGLACAG